MDRFPPTGIDGAHLLSTVSRPDARGCLTEVFREGWPGAFPARQWNLCHSGTGVVRGVHVHVAYDEIYVLASGRLLLGLHDIRPESPTYRQSVQMDWSATDGFAVVIPRGVAHVMKVREEALMVLGLSSPWEAAFDDIGCQWDDPALQFRWERVAVERSPRDLGAPDFATMQREYLANRRAWQASLARAPVAAVA